jgi:radical SAM superfamily enzyme YgiQ (UPF0313 family)
VLINPSHDDEIPEKIAVSYGAKSRKVRRYDPPISIINLGGFIRDHGYDVVILDTLVEENYQDKLKQLIKERPLIIGFSVILGKFTKNAITLTKMIKEMNQDIPVVWGGKLVHLAQDLILDHLDVDYIVVGDGEIPFLNLLDNLKNGKMHEIPGIGFKENGHTKINLNEYTIENLDDIYISKDFGWDLVKQNLNMRQTPYFVNLYTSRGCKFNCSFCYLKDIRGLASKLRFRRRSAENVISEIEYLHKKYGINVVTFGDDDFLSNLKEVKPIFEYLKKNNIFIEHLWTNVYNLNPAAIELLAGTCQTVCYSIETVSPRLQKILNKHISLDRIIKANKQLRSAGITTVHNILFGIPTETDDETKANIDCLKILKDINPHVRANTYILSPIPETPIFEFAKTVSKQNIEWGMEDLANFHFRYMGKTASKFRPYLTGDDNLFYETVSELTNELFTELNDVPSEEQVMKMRNDKRLSYIFGDIDKINKPTEKVRKYILDQVIESLDQGLPMPRIESF